MHRSTSSGTLAINRLAEFSDRLSLLIARLLGPGHEARVADGVFTLALAKGQAYSVVNPCGLRLTCTSGAIWLTFAGDLRDVVLLAGNSFHCTARTHLCISAFERSALQIARCE